MSPITPFLWFNTDAEEAANFYVSVFKDSKVLNVSRYGEGGPMPMGTAMTVNFQLNGREFIALNGGPVYSFSPAVSFLVNCETQQEVDFFWDKLTAGGGKPGQCGWLTDRFGLSWQIVPATLSKLLGDKDPERANRALSAMLQMTKLDIGRLEQAFDG